MQSGDRSSASENQREAEGYFRQALEIASRQSAHSLELRAAMSLSRMWQKQGKNRESHRLLLEVYGRIKEGVDTADLHDAKTLMEEVS